MQPHVVTEFTPWSSLLGGALIGVSVVMVMMLFGRIAGISTGALAALGRFGRPGGDGMWRIAFVAGLVAAPILLAILDCPVEQSVSDDVFGMAFSGLLVGIGTTLGSGGTSGHSVCGLPRLSCRSPAAVATFVAFAGATVFGIGWNTGGFCSGPAWTALPLIASGGLAFVPAMIVGLLLGGPLMQRIGGVQAAPVLSAATS